jgi:hypothetical protein
MRRLQIAKIAKNLAQYLINTKYNAASVPQIALKSESSTLFNTLIQPKKPGLVAYIPIITGLIVELPNDFSIRLFLLSIQ